MRVHVATSATILSALLAVAGCGGSGVAAPGAAGSPAAVESGAPPTPAPATQPVPAESGAAAETAAPAATSAGGGGGASGGWARRPCEVLTVAEAEAAAGVTGLTPMTLEIDPTSAICSYRDASNAVEVYAGVWQDDAADAQWGAMEAVVAAGADDVRRVEGLGGDAIYATSGSVLLVHKGDTLVQLTLRNPDLDEAAIEAGVLALGRAVLARL